MIGLLTKGITRIFGTKSERDIKEVLPYVEKTKDEYNKLHGITDDELRERTASVKKKIDDHLSEIDRQIRDLHRQIEEDESLDVHQKEDLFNLIDKLEENRNKELEEVLLDCLPEAFAIVKETARRFKEIGKLVVTATLHDKTYAAKH